MNQNFVPVVDDRECSVGIVRRQAIIRYCYDRSRAAAAEQRRNARKAGKTSPGFCRGAVKQEKAPPLCMKCAGQRGLSMPVGRGEWSFSHGEAGIGEPVGQHSLASSPPMASSSSTERVVEQRMVWKVMVSMPSARS